MIAAEITVLVRCPACCGTGDSGGRLWDDCCPACGGLGIVPQSEIDEYGRWIESARSNDVDATDDLLHKFSTALGRLVNDAAVLDGWMTSLMSISEPTAEDAELSRAMAEALARLAEARANIVRRLPKVELPAAADEGPF